MDGQEGGLGCSGRMRKLRESPFATLYVTYFLSKWGDRMWSFACGLFLVYLNDGLRLTAIFGFCSGSAMLLFGGLIGTWIDRSTRINAARVSLVIQNTSVALCAVMVCLTLVYEVPMKSLLNGNFPHIAHAVIITLAVMGNLASMGYSIAIEKDWVVVLSGGDKAALASMNAASRTISLTCQILAPTFVGVVMTYASLLAAAIIIAVWNLLSVAVEYVLLHRLFALEPRLAQRGIDNAETPEAEEAVETSPVKESSNKQEDLAADSKEDKTTTDDDTEKQTGLLSPQTDPSQTDKSPAKKPSKHLLVSLLTGWRVYFRQSVVPAGLALALLYITVMGFDSVTTGYIYKNGISEMAVAICSAIGGSAGILGAFLFVRIRRWVGLERTGLVAYQLEVVCLILAVISIWAPGSPFDPDGSSTDQTSASNCSNLVDVSQMMNSSVINSSVINSSVSYKVPGSNTTWGDVEQCDSGFNISVILFIIGIITSRIGLWMADLVVSQILQENVIESERGVVGGIQSALNMFMDMIKFAIIIALPEIQFFGIHILWSFFSICLAGCLFAFHSWRVRGHLFHFEKVRQCISKNGDTNDQDIGVVTVCDVKKPEV